MKDVAILMMKPMPPAVVEALDGAFTLLRAWEQPDPEAFVASVAGQVRGVAAGGHGRLDAAVFARFPRLEIVSSFGVGYDSIDAAEAGRRGLVVTNTPDVLTDEVADLALGLLLATIRQLPQADRHLRAGDWLKGAYPLTATLRGRHVGIVGLGRIGKAVARRLEGFGVTISYHGRRRQEDVAYPFVPTLLDLAKQSDVLISVVPGGPETDGMIGADVFAALGPTGIFVNVGRGSVVNEAALVEALAAKTIYAAGLDVFADEPRVPQALIDMDHLVLLPHVGSASVETRRAMGQLVVDNLLSWFAGKGPLTPVAETPWRADGR